jgi:alkyl hydroperoxide reductase subunit F
LKVINNSKVLAISGDKMVNKITISHNGQKEDIPVEGVFIEIGLVPNSGFAAELAKNKTGEIKVNCRNETNIPGAFACGDVTDVPDKQIIIAAGDGAKAALGAFRFLMLGKFLKKR